ncbi:MAG: hypothetical protein ACYCU5_00005, partial [Actinomycetes bacterium]
GVRTVPAHVLSRHDPVSVTAVKDAARALRWGVSPSPSLRDVRAAAAALLEAGQVTFTRGELVAQVAVDGGPWTAKTVHDLLAREVRAPHGQLERVRTGHYRLRPVEGGPAAVSSGGPLVERVRSALVTLAAGGQAAVTGRQLPVAVRTSDGRYQLAAGEGGGRDECAPGSGRHAAGHERCEMPGDDPMSAR